MAQTQNVAPTFTVAQLAKIVAVLARVVSGINADDESVEDREALMDFIAQMQED